MSAHLSSQEQSLLISRKLEQGLAPRQLADVFAHLDECAACRMALGELRNRVMQLSDTIEWKPTHLEFEQLAGYVANKLDEVEREIADNHLATCDFCIHEVQELTVFQRDLAAASASAGSSTNISWWILAKQHWAALTFKQVWTPALALCVLVLLIVLGGKWWQRRAIETSIAQQTIPITSPTFGATMPSSAEPAQTASTASENLLALSDNGQKILLGKDGRLTMDMALPPAYQSILATTLSQQRLALAPVLKSLAQPARTLKSSEPDTSSFAVLAPLGTVLLSDRPSFRWQAVAGATGYTVAVFDEDFNLVQTSATVTQTQWRATQPLPRGRVLLWQVTAQVGGKQLTAPVAPAPEARFQILAPKPVAELLRAQREFPQSHLLLGTLYAQAGLIEEARREFQALQAENPQSTVIKKLLQQLR